MTQAEGLTNANAGVQQNGKEQAVTQMITSVEDHLNLFDRKDFRARRRRLQLDRASTLGLVLGGVVQERLE
jgi:hypothetical protein